MDLTIFISFLIYLTFFILIYGASVKCEDGKDGLTIQHRKILKDYEEIATLTYGDKCNSELESQSDKINEDLNKLMMKALDNGMFAGKSDDFGFELTDGMEVALDNIFYEIDQFTKKVQALPHGLNGICNDSMILLCDKSVGECRCTTSKQIKGFSYFYEGGSCIFDFDSACRPVQSDSPPAELTSSICREGSICVTAIEKMNCSFLNSKIERMRNPSRFQNLKNTKGYSCFCDPIGDQNQNQTKFVSGDNNFLKSSDDKNSNSSPNHKRVSTESAASSYFNTSVLRGIFGLLVLISLQI